MLYLQEKQPFERIEVTRDQALEMFSDNKFKASIAFLFYFMISFLFLALTILSFVPCNHIDLNDISYVFSPIIYDITICCLGYMTIVIRSKLSMICPLTRLSQYTDVVPLLICVVDHIYLIHPLSKQLHV